MEIPRWYKRQEVKEWFERRGIKHSPQEIQMFTEALQKAFEKGWQKSLQQENSRDKDILSDLEEEFDFHQYVPGGIDK